MVCFEYCTIDTPRLAMQFSALFFFFLSILVKVNVYYSEIWKFTVESKQIYN